MLTASSQPVLNKIDNNNNNTNNIYNRNISDKKIAAIIESLLRISIIKTIPFENEYVIREVFIIEKLLKFFFS